jgi:hypothetical protein
MEQPRAVKPQVLEALVETLKADYKHLMTTWNVSWRTAKDREDARLALEKSAKDASAAIQSVEGTSDPELRRLHDSLVIQVELSTDAVKHPGSLRR